MDNQYWKIKKHPDWNREMVAFYKVGLIDGAAGNTRKDDLAFQGCYDQGYDYGQKTKEERRKDDLDSPN